MEWMELEGNSNAGTSVGFLKQLREKHPGPLRVIWDNAPAHRGEAMREYLRTPGLELRLVNLPGYSPDFNADEAIWGWAREEATGNLCLGSRPVVQEKVGKFLAGLSSRKDEVKRRCRTVLQSRAETLPRDSRPDSQAPGKCTSHLGFGLEIRRIATKRPLAPLLTWPKSSGPARSSPPTGDAWYKHQGGGGGFQPQRGHRPAREPQ